MSKTRRRYGFPCFCTSKNPCKIGLSFFIAYRRKYFERPLILNISALDEYTKFWQMPFEKVMHSPCDGTHRVSSFTQTNTQNSGRCHLKRLCIHLVMAHTGYQVLHWNTSSGKKQEERVARGFGQLQKD